MRRLRTDPVWFLVIGLSLLIALSLFLYLDPNLLIFGTLFFVGYKLARQRMNRIGSVICAIPFVLISLCVIPIPSILLGKLELYKYDLTEIKPAAPIHLFGHVRIERTHFSSDPESMYPCDQQCWIILFQPDVESVTVTNSDGLSYQKIRDGVTRKDARARTYKIAANRGCTNKVLENSNWQQIGISYRERDELANEYWQLVHSGVCLSSEPELDSYDLLLRSGYWQTPELRSSEEHEPTPFGYPLKKEYIGANYSEVRTSNNALLLRFFNSYVNAYDVPFIIKHARNRFYRGRDIGLNVLRERYFERPRHSYWDRHADTPFFEYDHLSTGLSNKVEAIAKAKRYIVELTEARASFSYSPRSDELTVFGKSPTKQGAFACNRPSNAGNHYNLYGEYRIDGVEGSGLDRCYKIDGFELIRTQNESVDSYHRRATELWNARWYLLFVGPRAALRIEPDGSSWWLVTLEPKTVEVGGERTEKSLGELLVRVNHDGKTCRIREIGIEKIARYHRRLYSACLLKNHDLTGL